MRKVNQTGGSHTIESVERQFSLWRRERKVGEKIPMDLWAAAARLTEEHSIHKVSRTLRLSHRDLKEHATQELREDSGRVARGPAFVELGLSGLRPTVPECTVELEV